MLQVACREEKFGSKSHQPKVPKMHGNDVRVDDESCLTAPFPNEFTCNAPKSLRGLATGVDTRK